jgi:hypothetical protein
MHYSVVCMIHALHCSVTLGGCGLCVVWQVAADNAGRSQQAIELYNTTLRTSAGLDLRTENRSALEGLIPQLEQYQRRAEVLATELILSAAKDQPAAADCDEGGFRSSVLPEDVPPVALKAKAGAIVGSSADARSERQMAADSGSGCSIQ